MMRWITGVPLAILIVCLLFFAPAMYARVLILALAVIGCWEFLTITLGPPCALERLIGCQLTAIGVGVFLFNRDPVFAQLFWYGLIVVSFLVQMQRNVDASERIRRAVYIFLGVGYCAFLFSHIGLLLDLPRQHFWLFLLLACTFMADTGAYLVGKRLGKHKLAPSISPGKSVEGLFGGIAGGIIAAWGVKMIFWPEFDGVAVTLLGIGLTLVGLLGDLSESMLKRGFGVKDSGKILPGHGGILDRVDALLFNAPWLYYVASVIYK